MEAIKKFWSNMYYRIIRSPQYLRFCSFYREYVTTTDLIVGGVMVGGFFIKPAVFGVHYLVPSLCGAYFCAKVGLNYYRTKYPSYYEECINESTTIVGKLLSKCVPKDFLDCYEVIRSVFEPYLSTFKDVSSFAILGGIYQVSSHQKPISLPSKHLTSADREMMHDAVLYSEMATGMYGAKMVYGLMGEISNVNDVKHILKGKADKEGYLKAFCDHCHISMDSVLYVNWGTDAEDAVVSRESIETSTEVKINPPPYFVIKDDRTKSIVLCIRGTWSVKDFISDFKCNGVAWGSGKAHEGIALIAKSMLQNDDLNKTIANALQNNSSYRVVAVGHSLGAGIACLITIIWRSEKLYNYPICYAFAPPPILSSSVWDKGVNYIYSFVNEDDVVPRLSKKGIEEAMQAIASNTHETKRSWLHRAKQNTVEAYQSILGSASSLCHMYLPGRVIYLHPCMNRYEEYENRKRHIGKSKDTSTWSKIQYYMTAIPKSEGGVLFEKGSDFPYSVILSPMVLNHHFAYNYENLIKSVYDNITSEVQVNML